MMLSLLLIPIYVKVPHLTGESGYIGAFGNLFPLSNLQGERVKAEEEIVFGKGFMEAADQQRQYIRKAPRWNRPILPSRERVPSGNMTTE